MAFSNHVILIKHPHHGLTPSLLLRISLSQKEVLFQLSIQIQVPFEILISKTELKCIRTDDFWASQVALVVKNPPADAGDLKDAASGEGETCGRSNMETYTAAAAAESVVSNPVRPRRRQPSSSCPWDSPGKNTGAGWKLTSPHVKQTASGNLLCGSGNSHRGSVSA